MAKSNSKSRFQMKSSGKSKNNNNSRAKQDHSYEHKDKTEIQGTNHISWYVNNPQMLKDVGSFPFSKRSGAALDYYPGFNDTQINTFGEWQLGAVATIHYIPTVGMVENESSSPLNVAMRSIYSFVRHANSGSRNYDAPDLMMYLLAMDSAYMFWSWCVRLYGAIRLYSMQNNHYPATIIKAMGIHDDAAVFNMAARLAEFRTFINNFAIRVNSYAVPMKFSLYTRHMWLTQNLFSDRDSAKAQVYVFNPTGFYQYDDTVGKLTLTDMPNTLDTIIEFGNAMLTNIYKSQDLGDMSGDILKAYGRENLFALGSIPEEFMVYPIYDPSVLTQIHNLTITQLTGDIQIIQDKVGGTIFQNFSMPTEMRKNNQKLINLHSQSPTPEEMIIATRLTSLITPDGTLACGSEVVTHITVWHGLANNIKQTVITNLFIEDASSAGDDGSTLQKMKTVAMASAFNGFPVVAYLPYTNSEFYLNEGAYLFADIDNYTVIDGVNAYNMHTMSLNGEFGIPYTLTMV